MTKHFLNPVTDVNVSKLILKHYFESITDALTSDVIIVGGGPSGLTAARELGNSGYKVVIMERKLSPGGGTWGGSMSFNKVVIQKDLKDYLNELEIPFVEDLDALVVDSCLFASQLIAKALKTQNVKLFNLMTVVDLEYTNNAITGVVVNNTGIEIAGLHVDPMVFQTKAVLDATGHDAIAANIYSKRVQLPLRKEHFMNAVQGEEDTVNNTKMLANGLFVSGMAANNVDGGSRMGPIFGGMIKSGLKAAKLIMEYIKTV
ncbi:thiazole-adenylate synthase [Thermodesulfobium acidiphilum]|uniref:Thiazole-adenylate synthase n=1 Tax=Thermodesulfobium acidiphilum TaxID=1794699 RepID=A0A2R4VZX6_THEAF|nr:sulfide-dependent adenosine diphosphate thiazole synthase [Thermodesulfobium acidiphilum]AWB10113.1 thiazole-adenylate synthase [Thermodesulfobium acidiphilum]PMP86907.1 MAG: thiazole biosynthesis protein [Thermodesulfobium narugense]